MSVANLTSIHTDYAWDVKFTIKTIVENSLFFSLKFARKIGIVTVLCSQLILWKTENPATPGLQVQHISPQSFYSFIREPQCKRSKSWIAYHIRDTAASKQIPSGGSPAQGVIQTCAGWDCFQGIQQTWEMKNTRWLLRNGEQRDVYIVLPVLGWAHLHCEIISLTDVTMEGNGGKIISVNGSSVN